MAHYMDSPASKAKYYISINKKRIDKARAELLNAQAEVAKYEAELAKAEGNK